MWEVPLQESWDQMLMCADTKAWIGTDFQPIVQVVYIVKANTFTRDDAHDQASAADMEYQDLAFFGSHRYIFACWYLPEATAALL